MQRDYFYSLSFIMLKKEDYCLESREFEIVLSALLNQSKSKKQINSDIKSLEQVINSLRLIATINKASRKEINAYIKQLEGQISTLNLKAKIDSKNLKREIDQVLNNLSFKDIDVLNIDGNKTRLKVEKVIADVRAYAAKAPISLNIDLKREKLDNQLTSYLTRNSKIRESKVLLKEVDKLREKISTVNDRNSLKDATDSFQLFKAEVQSTGYQAKSTTDKIKSMVSGITKVGSIFGVVSLAVNNFVKSMQTLKDNDTILTEISKTSEMTRQQLRELGDEAFKTASKYGQISSNYLLGVQEMARSGYEDTSKELGELSLLAQSAGNMTAEMANNYLLATDAAYKYGGSVEKLNAALDGANYISNKNSASLTDIADATRVSASFAANAGVAIDELTAAEATMVATTKRSGSEMGRAFRSIILNLQQVSGEFDGEVIDEEQLKKVEERCHSLGVELEYMKDGVATLRNPMEVLKDLADVYNSLPDNSVEKQGLISDLGGKYHANALSALLSRWDLYEKMLGEFSQGTDSALEEANKTADSWEGRLNALQNSWDSFVNTLTNKEAIKGGISFFDRLIQGAEVLTNTIGEIPVLMTAINGSMVAINKDYGITQVVNKDSGKLDIQGNLFGIDFTAIKAQKKHFEEAEKAISMWNQKLSNGITDLETFNFEVVKNNAQLKTYLATCSKDAPASLEGYQASLRAAGVSTDALRLKTILLNSAITMGVSLLVSVGISALASFIDKIVVTKKEIKEAADEAKATINDIKSDFDNLISTTDDIKQRFAELAQRVENLGKANQSRGKLSTEDYEEFLGLSNQLAALFPQLIRGYDDNGNAIIGLSGNVNTIVQSLNDLVMVQQKLATQQILEKMPDVWAGYTSDLKEYNRELDASENKVNSYQKALNKLALGNSNRIKVNNDEENQAIATAARNIGLDDGKWYQNKLAQMVRQEFDADGQFVSAEWDFSSLTDRQIEQLKNELGALGSEYEESVQQTKNKIESANAEMSSYISTWLSGEWNYSKMDSGMQNVAKDVLLNTDWLSQLPDDVDTNNWDEVSNWLQQNFLYAINNIDDEKIQTAFADILDGEFTIESIQEIIRQLLTTHGFDANNPLIIYLQTKMNDRKKKVYDVNKRIGSDDQNATDWINSLNEEELELADSDAFEQAIEKQREKFSGAALAAKDYEAALQSVKNEQDGQAENPISSFTDAWEQLKSSTDDATKDLSDTLTELAEQGRLTIDAFNEADSTDYFENLGISADEAVQKINALVSSSTQLQSMSAQISKMSDMLADKKNGNAAKASDLAGFDAEVRGLDSWKEFESVMGSSKSTMEQCQEAANNLATEWINSGNYLSNLNGTNKDYYVTALQNMGIENSRIIVLENLAKAGYELSDAEQAELDKAVQAREEIYALQIAEANDFIAKKDLNAAAQDAYAGLMQEAEGASISKIALLDLIAQEQVFNNTGLSVDTKINSLSALASAYLGTAAAAKFAASTTVSGMGSDPRYYTDSYVQDQWTDTLSNYKVNFDVAPSGSSGYKSSGSSGGSGKSGGSKSKSTIDWIERLLDVLQKKIDQTKAKFENLFTLKDRKNNLAKQIQLTKTLLTATEKSADRYLKAANKVKLSSKLKKKVREGSYDITEYDSDTADAISKYESYYDKYKELNQKADELKTDIRNLRTETYQLYVDQAESKITKSQAYAELDAGNYKKQNVHLEAQKKYLKESYKWQIKIAELNKDSVEAAKLKAQLQKELNDLTMQEFDNIANTYDKQVGLNENKIKAFQDQISLLEAKGQEAGSALYSKQISLNNINEKKLVAEREKLIGKLSEIPKGTDDWYDAQDKLFSVESALVNIQAENANLQKSINQLKFDRFDDLIGKLNDVVDETNFLKDMLDSDHLFDDNGMITDDGLTAVGLTAQNYDTYLAEAEKYKQMIADLEEMYRNGDIGITDYESKMREYKQGQMDAIKSANDAKKAVIDYVKQGLDAQNEALSEAIDKQKELLEQKKKDKDFNKTLADQNKEIARLERQIAVTENDSSDENKKNLRELRSRLQDLKDEQEDTLYDRSISDQEDALDQMLKNSQEQAENYLKDSEKVFMDAFEYVNAHTSQIANNIETIAKETGYDISAYIVNAWKNSGNAVGEYSNALSSTVPNIISQIALITQAWNEQTAAIEKASQTAASRVTDSYLDHTRTGASGNSSSGRNEKSQEIEDVSGKKHTESIVDANNISRSHALTKGQIDAFLMLKDITLPTNIPAINIPSHVNTNIPVPNRTPMNINIDNRITVDGVATDKIVQDMAGVAKKQAENVISEINRRTYTKGVRWR